MIGENAALASRVYLLPQELHCKSPLMTQLFSLLVDRAAACTQRAKEHQKSFADEQRRPEESQCRCLRVIWHLEAALSFIDWAL